MHLVREVEGQALSLARLWGELATPAALPVGSIWTVTWKGISSPSPIPFTPWSTTPPPCCSEKGPFVREKRQSHTMWQQLSSRPALLTEEDLPQH